MLELQFLLMICKFEAGWFKLLVTNKTKIINWNHRRVSFHDSHPLKQKRSSILN
jgi:hypothetical protein